MSPAGFNKLTAILPGVLNSGLSAGFNIGGGDIAGLVDYCGGSGGSCHINVALAQAGTSVTSANQLNVHVDANANTSVHLDAGFVGSCNLGVTVDHITADMDLDLGIRPDNGELKINVGNVNQLTFSGVHTNGCGFIGDIIGDLATAISDILDSQIGQFVVQLLTPVLDNLVQGLLPNPLGVANMVDVGSLMQGVSPGTTAEMEARVVPGGYVQLKSGGMSLGIITGINADEDITTRTPGLASEPALCVPPIPAPDFSAPPASLGKSTRNTFKLDAADKFDGNPEIGADLAMGISETTLDQLGHHLVTSGALCLGVGPGFLPQLNVGTLGLFVPSLAALDDSGHAPLLIVTRPQKALDFTVGDNAAPNGPALTIGIQHMEVDFYAFLYERYTRAFTIDVTLNVGIHLEFEQSGTDPVKIKPTLTGLSSQNVTLSVINSEFVRENPDDIAAGLSSVIDILTNQLGALPDITVPSFAGFTLENPSIEHVTTNEDDFLALFASLGAGASFRALAQKDPFAADALRTMDSSIVRNTVLPSTGTAKLAGVHTPDAAAIRTAINNKGGALPTVTFDVDRTDSLGRELEWAYNIDGGLWRTYQTPTADGKLVVSERMFAWQNKYLIGLKSRVKDNFHTVTYLEPTTVIIDSVPPTIHHDKMLVENDHVSIPVTDIVSRTGVQIAIGRPSTQGPATPWVTSDQLDLTRTEVEAVAEDGEIAVYAKDEAGNQSVVLVAPFHGTGNGQGCACGVGSTPTTGGLALMGLVGAAMFLPRRRRRIGALAGRFFSNRAALKFGGAWLALSLVLSLQPACSCSHKEAGQSCEMDSDCPKEDCAANQLPFCIQNTCVCADDIPPGRIGPYSAVAVGADGTAWVSAYAQDYGDLVVAKAPSTGRIPDESWEFVDGVPDGPVVVPGSMIRGGIRDAGPDVGMYTSIAVAPDGTPMVTYFDRDTASLKFAAKVNGVWQNHIVDGGTGTLEGGALVGMYTSITLRTDDGRPGVAYLAHVQATDGSTHAEVRFAASQVPVPTVATDWTSWVVDTAPLPVEDPANPDPYPLPGGLGLFIASARNPADQSPIVLYYDRANGDLKMSKFDTVAGQFAAPTVLAGTTDDAGWSPALAVDATGVVNAVYVDATKDDLVFVSDGSPAANETIDDGRRIVGTTVDGLPKPTYDLVGDDASIVLADGTRPLVIYQDATTQELLLAHKDQSGVWLHDSLAGNTDPWPGAYGFFASAALGIDEVVISTWVIDQPTGENWVEIFRRPTSATQ